MSFVQLAQGAPQTWKVDAHTGEQFVETAEVCGSSWWGFGHRWAEAVRDGCPSCGDTAVTGMSALHDLVNVELRKPLHDRENFERMVARYVAALKHASRQAQAPAQNGFQHAAAANSPQAPGDETIGMAQGLDEKLASGELVYREGRWGLSPFWWSSETEFERAARALRSVPRADGVFSMQPFPVAMGQGRAPAKVRITGTCKDGEMQDCRFTVKASDTVSDTAGSLDELEDAISQVRRRLAREGTTLEPATDRTFAVGPNGLTRYELKFRVVEVLDLVTSHDAFTFEPNAAFPGELQPRLRSRAATRLQVEQIAANLDADALLTDFRVLDRGTPIIGSDLLVESGNGRVMGIIRSISEFPAAYEAYRELMVERVAAFGIPADRLDGTRNPVLVRERISDVDRATFVEEANAAATLAISGVEQAQRDAARITLRMLDSLRFAEDQSIEDALRAPVNQSFAAEFLGMIGASERAALVDATGRLNQDGVRRMTMAIFVSALPGDPGLKLSELAFESVDLEVRNVINGIGRSLGSLATAEGLIRAEERPAELGIGADLADTVTVFAEIKRTPGLSVDQYLTQGQLFERRLTPFQETLLVDLDARRRSARRIGAMIRSYSDAVIALPSTSQGELIPGEGFAEREELWSVAAAVGDPEPEPLLTRMGQGLGDRIGEAFASGIGFGLAGHATRSALDRLTNAGAARSSETATAGLCQDGPKLSDEALKLDTSGHGDFVRERVANPDDFDPESFRTVTSGEHRVLAACPRGKWVGDRCQDGMEVVDILHPRSEAPQLVAEAEARGLPIEDAEMAKVAQLLIDGVAGSEPVLSGEHQGLALMRRELPGVRELVLVS